jgi:hypothetical protein
MKRSELVDKLIKEGMSEKTLVKFTDKQLNNLADRMLGEQVTTVPGKPSYKVGEDGGSLPPSPKGYKITKDPIDKSTIAQPVESEVKEELKGKQKNLDKNHNGKIDGQDFKILRGQKKEVKEGKKCDSCGESIKDCKCDHTHMDESKEIKKWINTLAEESFHSFTSKNEIMELINVKLNESEVHEYGPNVKTGHNGLPEFMTYDAIVSNGPKIAPSKPKVDPGTKPNKPKTPFQPGPKVNPNPKALSEDDSKITPSKPKRDNPYLPDKPKTPFQPKSKVNSKSLDENNPKIAPSKPKVNPGTKPNKPKTPFQPGPKVNPNPKATTKGDKK